MALRITHARLAATGSLAVITSGVSITCNTPLETRTSDCTILAVTLALKVPSAQGIPTVTKFPVEFVVNVNGSPAADICVMEVL